MTRNVTRPNGTLSGFVNGSGQGEPLRCPDGRTSLRSEIDYASPALPDTFYVYRDYPRRPGDYYRIWMDQGNVHDPDAEKVGKYEAGRLVTMGECDFPHKVENDRADIFRFWASGVVAAAPAEMLNLTLCSASPNSGVGI